MEFYYQRVIGPGGGVSRGAGQPPGARLGAVLSDGLPPINVALEIIAAFCEIIYIAHDDGELHGDVQLKHAWLNGDGVVSLGGFGLQPRSTSAPEGTPAGPPTDLYGIGKLAAGLLLDGSEALNALPTHSLTAHDDKVASFVMQGDLGTTPPEIDNDLRWYLLHLLAFDRQRRPAALKSWRSFIAFARTVGGPSLEAWAGEALRGRGERRDAVPGERLGGARGSSGPLTSPIGKFSKDTPRTAFWSPVSSAKSANNELNEPEEGGGEKTGHWSREQLMKMARGEVDAPAPQRRGGESTERHPASRPVYEPTSRAREAAPVAIPAAPPVPAPPAAPAAPPVPKPQPGHRAAAAGLSGRAPPPRPSGASAAVTPSAPAHSVAPHAPPLQPNPTPGAPEPAPTSTSNNPFADLPDWAILLLVASIVFFGLTLMAAFGGLAWYVMFAEGAP
jgi:hypothetical protein